MMHKFRLRQRVQLIGQPGGKSVVGASYEVIRLMPVDQGGEPTYRIKSAMEERAVRESEINPAR